ncbi:MAG: site-specific integrase, partial [Pseudomonadota bacterium]
DEEISRLSSVLADAEASGDISIYVAAAFRMLLLTGCRLSEIQFLKWEYVTRTHLVLPDTKTGKRAIPLPDAGRKILDALPRNPENPFTFQGEADGKPAVNLEKPWRRIRAKAGLDDVRIHDLRHTYASKALASGMSLYMVGQLLGHTQYQTTMRYAHLADAPVRDAANQVANALSGIVAESPTQSTALRVVK